MFKRVKTAEKKGMLATIKNNEIYLKCENCGMWFMQVCNKKGPVYTKTCSEKCSHANFQGENNPNYKGAVNRGKKRSYAARLSISRSKRGENNWRWQGGSKRYRGSDWRFARKEALRRDSRTCQKCGSKHNIVVHHIDPYKDSKNNRLSNLVTLCRSCHIDVHNLLIAKSKKVKACQVAR